MFLPRRKATWTRWYTTWISIIWHFVVDGLPASPTLSSHVTLFLYYVCFSISVSPHIWWSFGIMNAAFDVYLFKSLQCHRISISSSPSTVIVRWWWWLIKILTKVCRTIGTTPNRTGGDRIQSAEIPAIASPKWKEARYNDDNNKIETVKRGTH